MTEPDSSKSPTKFIVCKCLTNSAAKNQHQEMLLGDTWEKTNPTPNCSTAPHGDGENSWEETLRILMKGRRNNFTFLREFSQFDTESVVTVICCFPSCLENWQDFPPGFCSGRRRDLSAGNPTALAASPAGDNSARPSSLPTSQTF